VNYRTLGRTGLSVSALGLGTVELGLDYGIGAPGEFGRPAEADSIRLVHAALDAGINFVDTARAYGDSERVLGVALAKRRDDVVIATKVDPLRRDGSVWEGAELHRYMQESLETSLRLLGTDHIDIWMIHSINAAVLGQREIIADVFADARRRGQIGWTGASFYGADLPEEALGYDLFDVMQVTYSVLDQRLNERVFPLAAERDVGIVVRSILLKGALTERAEHLPPHLEPLRMRSRQFRALLAAADEEMTPAQGAILFGLANPHIDTVLVGVRTEAELAEDLTAIEMQLSPQELGKLLALGVDDESLLDPSTWGIP
jgi:aryl-alcohol dehydrogenase-like predicted oxidoreductase